MPNLAAELTPGVKPTDLLQSPIQRRVKKRARFNVLDPVRLQAEESRAGAGTGARHLDAGARPVTERLRRRRHADFKRPRFRQMMMQGFFQDPPLEFKLLRILQMLPLASAANSEMRARGILPSGSGLQKLDDGGARKVPFLFRETHPDPVARSGEWDKDHLALMAAETGAAVDQLVDFDFKLGGATRLHR